MARKKRTEAQLRVIGEINKLKRNIGRRLKNIEARGLATSVSQEVYNINTSTRGLNYSQLTSLRRQLININKRELLSVKGARAKKEAYEKVIEPIFKYEKGDKSGKRLAHRVQDLFMRGTEQYKYLRTGQYKYQLIEYVTQLVTERRRDKTILKRLEQIRELMGSKNDINSVEEAVNYLEL